MKRSLQAAATVALLALGLTGGCHSEGAARVVRSGFSHRGPYVGVGAIVRSESDMADIGLRITYRARGSVVSREDSTLPSCPADIDCPWGHSSFASDLGPRAAAIDDVSVTVVGSRPGTSVAAPRAIAVRRVSGSVRLERSGSPGTLFVIARSRGAPVYGYTTTVRHGETGPLVLGSKLFTTRKGDVLRAYLYPHDVAAPGD